MATVATSQVLIPSLSQSKEKMKRDWALEKHPHTARKRKCWEHSTEASGEVRKRATN
jgi:hypothetical protein